MRCVRCNKQLEPWEQPQPVKTFDGIKQLRLLVPALCDRCARATVTRR